MRLYYINGEGEGMYELLQLNESGTSGYFAGMGWYSMSSCQQVTRNQLIARIEVLENQLTKLKKHL